MDKVNLLDHGYVSLVETWGSDEAIVSSARMSTGKGFLGWDRVVQCTRCLREWETDSKDAVCNRGDCCNAATTQVHPGDKKLLKFLADNKHTSPFEFAGATFEVQAPILCFREWHRHRTQSYSEMSARYTPLPDVNYIPSVERLLVNSKTNKQAGVIKGAEELTEAGAEEYRTALALQYRLDQQLYDHALQIGVPKELARVHLPVGRYSRMRASTDLHNWLGFLRLRCAAGAQWEIRCYADAIRTILTEKFPRTLALFAPPA